MIGIVAVLGCKSPGTITLEFDFDLAHLPDCRSARPADYLALYAIPKLRCEQCTCGQCFGRDGAQLFCGKDEPCEVPGTALDLDPEHWAVVLDLLEPGTAGDTLVASQCLDIDVDEDGVASSTQTGADSPAECAELSCTTAPP